MNALWHSPRLFEDVSFRILIVCINSPHFRFKNMISEAMQLEFTKGLNKLSRNFSCMFGNYPIRPAVAVSDGGWLS